MNSVESNQTPADCATQAAYAVKALWRYPVKGLSPEEMTQTALSPGEGIPGDRRYALAHGNTPFDPAKPEWLPKHNYIMLARNPALAALTTRWIEVANTLTIERKGRHVARGDLSTPVGRAVIADFISAYLKDEVRGTPHLVDAPGHMFSDHKSKVLSLITQASLEDMARVVGQPVDARRFRANVLIDGPRAWEEFSWVGREITLGGARLKITQRIDRCPATSANPDSGKLDVNIPRTLKAGFGHIHFGVYAEVIEGGAVALGDGVQVSP
jgi:uncharacterized protein YcbX